MRNGNPVMDIGQLEELRRGIRGPALAESVRCVEFVHRARSCLSCRSVSNLFFVVATRIFILRSNASSNEGFDFMLTQTKSMIQYESGDSHTANIVSTFVVEFHRRRSAARKGGHVALIMRSTSVHVRRATCRRDTLTPCARRGQRTSRTKRSPTCGVHRAGYFQFMARKATLSHSMMMTRRVSPSNTHTINSVSHCCRFV